MTEASCTKAQFARSLGVSKARVSQYLGAGMPVNSDGSIRIARAREWIERNIVRIESAEKKIPGKRIKKDAKVESLTEARARKESALASLHELELKVRASQLLEARDVEEVWSRHLVAARDNLLLLPAKIAPRVVDLSDVFQIQEVIREHIYEVLTTLSQQH